MTFTACFRRLYAWLLRLLCPRAAARREDELAHAEAERLAASSSVVVDDNTQRINLSTLLCRFFSRLTIQEPTLQEVVVVYAELRPPEDYISSSSSSGGAGGAGGSSSGSGSGSGSGSTGGGGGSAAPVLRLKSFRDIPLADVEVVLPGLKVDRMKSADVVKLVVILVSGIAAAVYSFMSARADAGDTSDAGRRGRVIVYVTFFGLLVFRGIQTWCSVVNSKYTMNEFIRTTLYHRSQDSQRGVLLSVLNSIAQHELRETLALYLLMRAHGRQLGAATHGANSSRTLTAQYDASSRTLAAQYDASSRTSAALAVAAAGGGPTPPPPALSAPEGERRGDTYLSSSSLLSGMLGSRRRAPPGLGSMPAATPDREHQVSVARALADGCISLVEAGSLMGHFFRSEFHCQPQVHTAEALERLLRLGLIHHATLRTATATATAPSKLDTATPRSPPPDYATVPVADALAQLRARWGTMARAPAPTATTGRNASALLNLTKPVHGGHLGDRASRSSFELGDHAGDHEAPSPLRGEERLSLQDKWSTAHLE